MIKALKQLGLLWLVGWLAAPGGLAQTSTNQLALRFTPAANSLLIANTTNRVEMAITNLAITNQVVEPDPWGGPLVTNLVVTPLFTNLVVTATNMANGSLALLDDGSPPDTRGNDGIYTGWLVTPTATAAINLEIEITITGDDLGYTNEFGWQEIVPFTNIARISYLVVPRPANDAFDQATKVPSEGGIIIATNNLATLETNEPSHGGVATVAASVWWKWSSPVTTNVLIDTAGTSFSPVLAVYTGATLSKLTLVSAAQPETTPNYPPWVQFTAQAGITYRIAVAGQSASQIGGLRLRIAPGALPDRNGPATHIDYPDNAALFTTNWIDFRGTALELFPNESGVASVYLQISGLTPILMQGTTQWNGTVDMPPGVNIVQAYALDYAGNRGSTYTILIRYIDPTNDFFSQARELTNSAGVVTAVNGRATREPGEPFHAGNEGGHSIWYRWRAPANGLLSLTTTNSDFDTLLALYTGTTLANLATVSSNDDAFDNSGFSALSQYVLSNQLYYIAVDGYGGASGHVQLGYQFKPGTPPDYRILTLSTTEGGTLSPASGFYRINSTVVLKATPDPDYQFLLWEGSVTSTNNPLAVIMDQDRVITARFRFINLSETFESGNWQRLPWTTFGAAPWVVQTNITAAGLWAARSGRITNGEQSVLQLTINSLGGRGWFEVKVSSENTWDYLEFRLNGKSLQKWSGEANWQTYYYEAASGMNTLEWRYVKDPNFSAGLDAAFLDNLYIPLGHLEPWLELAPATPQSRTLRVHGKFYQPYIVLGSSSQSNWLPLLTNASPEGVFELNVPVNQGRYFYRALKP